MKKIILLILVSILLISFSLTEIRKIDTQKSTIHWKGTKVIGSSHVGTIQLKSGYFIFDNQQITGGEFVIDMNTINSTDLKNKKKATLEKHLKDIHFFGVSKYPTSRFKISQVNFLQDNKYKIIGNFTIKNKTNSNTFVLTVSEHSATGKITIKRNEFDVKYGTGFFAAIGNKAISNTFTLQINLQF